MIRADTLTAMRRSTDQIALELAALVSADVDTRRVAFACVRRELEELLRLVEALAVLFEPLELEDGGKS